MEALTESTPRPCPFSLLAATFALMTRYAAPMPDGRVCETRMRSLLARKIVSNLFFLRHHPDLPHGFGQIVANIHAQWQALATGDSAQAPATRATVH